MPVPPPFKNIPPIREEPQDLLESSSSSESEPETDSEPELLPQRSHSPSAKPYSGLSRVGLPAHTSGILDSRAQVRKGPGDISLPLSRVGSSSPSDEQPQLPAPYPTTMTVSQKKLKKDKDEKAVEDLAGSFMQFIIAALELGDLEPEIE